MTEYQPMLEYRVVADQGTAHAAYDWPEMHGNQLYSVDRMYRLCGNRPIRIENRTVDEIGAPRALVATVAMPREPKQHTEVVRSINQAIMAYELGDQQ